MASIHDIVRESRVQGFEAAVKKQLQLYATGEISYEEFIARREALRGAHLEWAEAAEKREWRATRQEQEQVETIIQQAAATEAQTATKELLKAKTEGKITEKQFLTGRKKIEEGLTGYIRSREMVHPALREYPDVQLEARYEFVEGTPATEIPPARATEQAGAAGRGRGPFYSERSRDLEMSTTPWEIPESYIGSIRTRILQPKKLKMRAVPASEIAHLRREHAEPITSITLSLNQAVKRGILTPEEAQQMRESQTTVIFHKVREKQKERIKIEEEQAQKISEAKFTGDPTYEMRMMRRQGKAWPGSPAAKTQAKSMEVMERVIKRFDTPFVNVERFFVTKGEALRIQAREAKKKGRDLEAGFEFAAAGVATGVFGAGFTAVTSIVRPWKIAESAYTIAALPFDKARRLAVAQAVSKDPLGFAVSLPTTIFLAPRVIGTGIGVAKRVMGAATKIPGKIPGVRDWVAIQKSGAIQAIISKEFITAKPGAYSTVPFRTEAEFLRVSQRTTTRPEFQGIPGEPFYTAKPGAVTKVPFGTEINFLAKARPTVSFSEVSNVGWITATPGAVSRIPLRTEIEMIRLGKRTATMEEFKGIPMERFVTAKPGAISRVPFKTQVEQIQVRARFMWKARPDITRPEFYDVEGITIKGEPGDLIKGAIKFLETEGGEVPPELIHVEFIDPKAKYKGPVQEFTPDPVRTAETVKLIRTSAAMKTLFDLPVAPKEVKIRTFTSGPLVALAKATEDIEEKAATISEPGEIEEPEIKATGPPSVFGAVPYPYVKGIVYGGVRKGPEPSPYFERVRPDKKDLTDEEKERLELLRIVERDTKKAKDPLHLMRQGIRIKDVEKEKAKDEDDLKYRSRLGLDIGVKEIIDTGTRSRQEREQNQRVVSRYKEIVEDTPIQREKLKEDQGLRMITFPVMIPGQATVQVSRQDPGFPSFPHMEQFFRSPPSYNVRLEMMGTGAAPRFGRGLIVEKRIWPAPHPVKTIRSWFK